MPCFRLSGLVFLMLIVASLALAATAYSDEGMWVFNNLPLARLKDRYGFEPPAGWAEHLRSASVRFNNGGSGSFVSADGLIMTNHHVGADTLAKLGTRSKDYHRDGFLAKSHDEEVRAPDLELNVLLEITNVTDRVNHEVTPEMDDARAGELKRKAMAQIEKEATDKNGLRNDVVTLYQGGQYHLYTYKKYTDVRLVFAPEFDIAFFGGDPDNFEYPRYDLDICFFRAYENDRPAKIEHFLKWGSAGTKEGDLVFVSGHPGHTDRLNTLASLEYVRDVEYPVRLGFLKAAEAFLLDYARRSPEAARHSKEELFTIQNSRKARLGGLEGLRDKSFMKRKAQAEADSRSRAQARNRASKETAPPRGKKSPRLRRSPPRSPSPTSITSEAMRSIVISSSWPAISCGWRRRRPSPTPNGSKSIANRPSSRSSSSSIRARPSTASSKRRGWRFRWPTGRRRCRTTR